MIPGQYIIPSELQPDTPPTSEIGSTFVSVEIESRLGEYSPVKVKEKNIDEARADATEAILPTKSALDHTREALRNIIAGRLVGSAPLSLHDQLVEAESLIGGKLFANEPGIIQQRFWYHEGDWFYEAVDAKGAMVARYQFSENLVHKLVDGREIAFAEGEKTALIETINRYYTQIQVELYQNKADWDIAA
jgi:hypothetical protein